jgi:hypothetical protein
VVDLKIRGGRKERRKEAHKRRRPSQSVKNKRVSYLKK